MPQRMSFAEIEARMRSYLARAGLRQPDAVESAAGGEEVHFIWHEEKVVVIVDREDEQPRRMRLRTA